MLNSLTPNVNFKPPTPLLKNQMLTRERATLYSNNKALRVLESLLFALKSLITSRLNPELVLNI